MQDLTRRQALASGAAAIAATYLPMFSAQAAPLTYTLAPRKIGDGIWMLAGVQEAITFENGGATANITILDSKDGAIVIDTGPSKRFGEQLAAVARELTGKDVARVYQAIETSERTRRAALTAMGALTTATTRDLAVAAMDHPNPQFADLAREAAARLGDPRATVKIMAILESRRPSEWPNDAVEALGVLHADAALPLFARQFPSASRGLKLAMLRACRTIGGRDAIALLVEGTINSDAAVASLARNLLGRED